MDPYGDVVEEHLAVDLDVDAPLDAIGERRKRVDRLCRAPSDSEVVKVVARPGDGSMVIEPSPPGAAADRPAAGLAGLVGRDLTACRQLRPAWTRRSP
jgi:hypothetical protein